MFSGQPDPSADLGVTPPPAAVPRAAGLPYNAGVKPRPCFACRPRLALLALPLAAALIAGCDQPAEITTYETLQVQPRVVAVDPNEVRAILHHMFAAIIPAGDKAWFFKLVVPGSAAAEMKAPFDKFLATVDVGDMVDVDADKNVDRPTWKLPPGWTEQPGGKLRAATILIPHGNQEFALAVSSLPLSGAWPAYLKLNVDRWMEQLQQPPLAATTSEKLGRTVPTGDGKATVFELVGMMKGDPMGAGLTGMPADHPPLRAPQGERTPLNPASTAADADESAAAGPSELTYDAPTDWEPGPLNVGMFKREASFKVADASGKAELAVTRFAAHGEMAALGPNVRRWAAQVGIVDLTEEDIEKSAHAILIDGAKALQFEFLTPGDSPAPQGILAAMAVRGDEVWFVKLTGDKPTIENQREAFEGFLKSIRFNANDN